MKVADPQTTRIGFIGLGLMGLPMATNVLRAGYRIAVYNRTPSKAVPLVQAGAEQAATPAEVAQRSDIVVTIVTDGPDVEAVVAGEHGVLAGARPGTIWVDMSTISPDTTRRLAEMAAAKGVECLDAPVSGGPPGAQAGTLSIMVGGRREVFELCLPLLRTMGSTIIHIGQLGAGQVAKACNQIAIAATMAGVAEALVLGSKAGVDPARIREALLGGYAQSRVLEVHGQRMIDRAFAPGFFVRLHDKDLHIVLAMARSLGAAAPITALAAQHFNSLMAQGDGELDNSAMVKVYEALADHRIA
jgi:2-hydroxy-3-oxopropionate reductase